MYSDTIKCVQCGEPWETWSVSEDMLPWQTKLFNQGAGCPVCEGEPNPHYKPQWTLSHMYNGDHNEMDRGYLHMEKEEGNLPTWERPEDKVFWTCECCGVQAIGNIDYKEDHEDYLDYLVPWKSMARHWWSSHRFDTSRPERNPAHSFPMHTELQWVESPRSKAASLEYVTTREMHVCEFCLDHCEHCGEPIVPAMDGLDTYDPGFCRTLEGYNYDDFFCIECASIACEHCNGIEDDCNCTSCPHCYEHVCTEWNDTPDVCPHCEHTLKEDGE